ncbi:MAG: hypothetical protein EBW81_09150 [Gammaproteobacteria bacterium]|nr:hypothetical protein [Gammaproteobacteria bacterium]
MELEGFKHVYSGKVRELYEPEDPQFSHLVLIVASDRISAFDYIHSPDIPGKGENLTEVTSWWLERLDYPNHLSDELEVPEAVRGRAVVAKRIGDYFIYLENGKILLQDSYEVFFKKFNF